MNHCFARRSKLNFGILKIALWVDLSTSPYPVGLGGISRRKGLII
jgi:hypothetical protein